VPRILFLENGKLTGDGDNDTPVTTCPGYADAYHRREVELA